MNQSELLSLICILGLCEGTTEHLHYFNTSDFSEILTRPTFVDKTLLIRTFFQEAHQVLITAPSNFGKSTNMDMLKRFLEITDQNGFPDNRVGDNCKLFQRHNLKIYRNEVFFNEHCGKHPVIFIDFRLAGGDSLRAVLDGFRAVLHVTFRQHGYLLRDNKLSECLKKQFKLYYDETYNHLTETDVLWGFRLLSELLQRHFKREVFILIDNYDYPSYHVTFYSDLENRKTDNFIRDLVSYLLKCNPHVNRALINSSQRPSKILFTGITNIELYTFLGDHSFAQFYGFTENEVYDLTVKFEISDEFEEIKRRCDQYEVKSGKFKIYNSWAVVCYFEFNG